MTSPPVDRSLDSLAPMFRAAFLAWLAEATRKVSHVDFRVTETRRTRERQAWLYAQGRQEPFKSAPVVTWTLDSRHRWGLAADLAMIRKSTGHAIWEVSSWQWLYKQVPLEPFGLRTLGPAEWVHIELFLADYAIKHSEALGLVQT